MTHAEQLFAEAEFAEAFATCDAGDPVCHDCRLLARIGERLRTLAAEWERTELRPEDFASLGKARA